ncbi:MAG TPA: PilZ domain-containing protein [Fimbriimonadaceae bacterium]|nr:PilZ domain-containing protein [Fimbriimonadaceae bacterium]
MDATADFILSGLTGCSVDVVIYDDGQTQLLKSTVEHSAPLRLAVQLGCLDGIRPGRRVMLLAYYEGLSMRADGHLDQIRSGENGRCLEISNVHWELLERRRHIRVPVSIPVAIKVVIPGRDTSSVHVISGTSLDMSISGAFVKVSELPQEGALVEFSTEIDGEPIKTLAVVARVTSDRNGIGLHFVEYIENARFKLQNFLTKAA